MSLHDAINWDRAIEHYNWDRLEAAFEIASSAGIGLAGRYLRWYRQIEAEYTTRKRATRRQVTDWLEVEIIPDEAHGREEAAAQETLAAAEETAARFRYAHESKVLVSVLSSESDAPWTAGRYGYYVDKEPYDKICLPHADLHRPGALHETMRHEYAHVIAHNLSGGRAPRWLDEAVAMVAQGGRDPVTEKGFATGRLHWLEEHELDMAYNDPDRDERRMWAAYMQSACLGRYLAEQGGEPKLGELLRAFTNNSILAEFKITLNMQSASDEALGEVYGLTVRELFEQTLAWLKT
jgi:hypothetical protein